MTCRSAPIYTNLTFLKSPFPRVVCPDAPVYRPRAAPPSLWRLHVRSALSLVSPMYCLTRCVCLPLLELNPMPVWLFPTATPAPGALYASIHRAQERIYPRAKSTHTMLLKFPYGWLFGKIILPWTLLLREVGRNRKRERQVTTGSCGEAWPFPSSGGV